VCRGEVNQKGIVDRNHQETCNKEKQFCMKFVVEQVASEESAEEEKCGRI
jgi:hypothetical protein